MIKQCNTCSVDLIPETNWSPGLIKSKTRLCRSCNAAKGRAFYAQNKAHVIETAKIRRNKDLPRNRAYWIAHRAANGDAHREREQQAREALRASVTGRARVMCVRARWWAKKRGVAYDLTPEWVAERLELGRCEATGLPLVFDQIGGDGGSRTHPFSPSLDRIKQGGGYTRENVRVTAFIYNVARSDFADDDLLTLARALVGEPSST